MTAQERARTAFADGAWSETLTHYRAADAGGVALSPDDLERMGVAAWFLGEPSGPILERACQEYADAGRVHDATRVAAALADHHGLAGNPPLAMKWARRAMSLLDGAAEGPGHGRLALLQGFLAVLQRNFNEAFDLVQQAHRLATQHGDADTEAMALSRRAALQLRFGNVEEASSDVDGAMLLVHGGSVGPLSGAMIYCNTIDFCRDLGDYERAFEWTDAAASWISERQVCGFPGICRVHRAELLRLRGDHLRAVAEIRAAMSLFDRHRFGWAKGYALTELGLQYLELAQLDDAERAFEEAVGLGHDPLPGVAMVMLSRGSVQAARARLEAGVAAHRDNPLGRARLLPTLVRACLGLDDLAAARAAAQELRATAETIGTAGLLAAAEVTAARVHLAAGEGALAIRSARAGARLWTLVGACYELGQAREVLASAYDLVGDAARASLERERARVATTNLADAATVLASASDLPQPYPNESPAVQPRSLVETQAVREGVVLDGKIEIGGVLGAGGMGIVHAARHLVTGRDVAVKVLKRRACGDARRCEQLLREARACGSIRHPNVVDIYDAGLVADEPYIVMERLEGQSLFDVLASGGRLALDEALDVTEQAARGVAAAHEAGIIHRDLKPGNVFVTDRGIKVLDFGISKQSDARETNSDDIVGTPFYMAPEQVLTPGSVDARTDVYALGALLFELLTGHPPFVGSTIVAVVRAIMEADVPRIVPEVPAAVEAVVRRALSRDPEERHGSAAELADALRALRAGRVDQSRAGDPN